MSDRAPIRYQGEVVEWSDEKRCGFIRPRGAKEADPLVFVGMASMATKKRGPQVGDILIYERIEVPNSAKTRRLRTPYRAENATFLGEEVPQAPDTHGELTVVVLGVVYLALVGLACLFHPLALAVLAVESAASIAVFAVYWVDKACAETGRRRVPESTLHAWAFLGGWPGAAVAQKALRHKTRKASFQNIFRLMVFLNVLLTGCVLLFTFFTDAKPDRVLVSTV